MYVELVESGLKFTPMSEGGQIYHPLAYVVIVHPIGNRSDGGNAAVKLFHPLPYNAFNSIGYRSDRGNTEVRPFHSIPSPKV